MILRRIIALAFLICGAAAHAQNVSVIGPVTPGNIPQFNSTTIIKDSGFSPSSITGGVIIVTNSIQAAYNSCPSTGGTVYVPVNYTETFTADLTLNTSYCGLVFLGPATLNMGSHHIFAGTSVDGVFMRGTAFYMSSNTGLGNIGVNIVCATTSGACVTLGSTGTRSNFAVIANVTIDMRAASASTIGLNLVRTVLWTIDHVTITGGNANNTGLEIDGTLSDFGGFGTIIQPQIRNFQKGIVTTGQANAIQMIGGLVDCNSIASSAALTRDGTLGNVAGMTIIGTEISTATTGISFISVVDGDKYILIYNENNTTDINASATSLNNSAEFVFAPVVSDSGTNNSFVQNGARTGAALSVLGNSTNATAKVADIAAASDGNVLRRSGTSVGFGPILLSTAQAVSGQLQPANGGTGVNNGSSTLALGGNTAFSGAFTFTGTLTANTSITFPTAGTLATVNGNLGTFTGTSLALNGCTIGTDNLCVNGTSTFGNNTTVQKNQNATTSLSLTNTDTTNGNSRASILFTAGSVQGRMLGINGDAFYLGSTTVGTPFNLQVGASNILSLASTGATSTGNLVSTSATGGVGYATGAGGAVTQATSRTTGVTLNKITGSITLVSAAGSASFQTFTVSNTTVAATDVVKVVQASGTDKYEIFVTKIVGGTSFDITFATTGGTTTEQPVFNFAVLKGVTS